MAMTTSPAELFPRGGRSTTFTLFVCVSKVIVR
jgi:hypothetical protein